ncbi:MAG: ATP-binding cassette domain-containing protein [Anaerolineae bacterium]|nr:ATP-binding cassette domain-containing protein [Anaerolineae bacterium]MDH7473124.1 ATP-binding cassette domain-containing protein [Anaerolineae bacterium]
MENLTHIYSQGTPFEHVALREVNLEIAAGERVGILGPTGSGKSTLVQLLAGLFKPTSGRVLLEGESIHGKEATARRLRLQVGLAFQYPEDQIFEQTVFREIAFGLRNLNLRRTEIEARVNWALEMVGLNPAAVAQRMPFALSGGERRRVALASILAMHPRVLILDEPTAGQDSQGRRALLENVGRWQRETGMTLIIVSHALEDLAVLVERVIALKEGRVVADGPARQVLSDAPLLLDIGLDVPEPVALLQALRQAGKNVRVDCFLPAEAAAEIARAWGLQEIVS